MDNDIEISVTDLLDKYGDDLKELTKRAIIAELEVEALKKRVAELSEATDDN